MVEEKLEEIISLGKKVEKTRPVLVMLKQVKLESAETRKSRKRSAKDEAEQKKMFMKSKTEYVPNRELEEGSFESVHTKDVEAEIEYIPAADTRKVGGKEKQSWYDGTTFSCTQCGHTSSSLIIFRQHVKAKHKTPGQDMYSMTKEQYESECLCCGTKILHEKKMLKEHMKTHFLSLAEYQKMYGKASRLRKRAASSFEECKQLVNAIYREGEEDMVELKQETNANCEVLEESDVNNPIPVSEGLKVPPRKNFFFHNPF